jgi:4-diphosphocytidyl-2-C-methyl-D-erythritol kinase
MCSASLSVRCFAKINMSLRVLGVRPDGFHDIQTIFQSIDLHDVLHLRLSERQDQVSLSCSDPSIPTDSDNLSVRAANEFKRRSGLPSGIDMVLEKRIPVAAGLGGGSSDAAAALRALNLLAGEPLPPEELAEVAATLGSDVPYFLLGGTALGEGRGERLTPMADDRTMQLLLLAPRFRVSARSAYELFDLTFRAGISDSTLRLPLGQAQSSGITWHNDLERGVFDAYPELVSLKEGLLEAGAEEAVMSGSGPVIVGNFTDSGVAAHAAEVFRARGVGAIICGSLTRSDFRRKFVIARKREK